MSSLINLYKNDKKTDNYTLEDIILIHIKAENSNNFKDSIDTYHSNIFRGYRTTSGYNNRYKKYILDNEIQFPSGISILPIVFHMSNGNEKLARMESTLVCTHPQTLLANEAVITLYKTKNMEDVKKVLKEDEVLLSCCSYDPSITFSDLNFLNGWCRHYLLIVIYAFNGWDTLSNDFDSQRDQLKIYLYTLCSNFF